MEAIQSLIEMVVDRLEPVADVQTVVGEPRTIGEHKVIPISLVSFGFGGGGGGGEGEGDDPSGAGKGKGKAEGGGCGAGVRIRPVAVVVIGPSGVQTLPIGNKKGKVEKLLDLIPTIVDKVKKVQDELED